jgi:hypothetical protein
MPRTKEDILKDGAKTRFSSSNQPKNYRGSTKMLTEMLMKDLDSKKDIIIEGIDVLTGEKRKIRVPVPTKAIITRALLTKAAKGDVYAIREVFDRVEGKAQQNIDVTTDGESLNEKRPSAKLPDGTILEI